MRVLGRELEHPFDAFWRRFGPEVDTPIHEIEEGHKAVFGSESYGVGSGDLPGWLELPDEALSYHVAHELTHLVMRRQGFPNNVRGPQYSEDSQEARVGGDLEEMISHPCLEEMLRPFPFDRTHIQQHLFEGARRGLEGSPVPKFGTHWWLTWACRFCELQFLLPHNQWLRLEVVYDDRCPGISEKGRELVDIMLKEGFQTPDQALQAMSKARDALGLKEAQRCLVLDPRDGAIY